MPGDGTALAVSVDTCVQGVHFDLRWSSAEDVGWRAARTALSDLAASRARPIGALVALSAHRDALVAGGLADRVMAGAISAFIEADCPLVGGDTVHTEGPLTVSVTVLGRAVGPGPLLRSGARPGDLIQVSGPTGLAAWGLMALRESLDCPPEALSAHRRPRHRLDLIDALGPATAGIDISDGLLADAAWIARASSVTLRLSRSACLTGPVLRSTDPRSADWILSGGDDYELLVTAPTPILGFGVIGVVEAGPPLVVWTDGSSATTRGWDHGDRF